MVTEVKAEKPSIVTPMNGMEIEKPKTKGRTVAIVGFAETSRMQVLQEPKDTEIWSLNRCYVFLERWDRWYELHEQDLYTGKTGLREKDYVELLKKSNVPIYMQHPDPMFPKALQFPKDEIIHMFCQQGENGFDYFTTSIAYMLAHVAYEHKLGQTVAEMHIYGVDMSAYSEYSEQLPCVNFWLGVLMGMGIKVVIPSVSPLLKCAAQYGRHSERPLWKMVSERIQHHKSRQAQLQSDLSALAGMVQEYGVVFDGMDKMLEELKKGVANPESLINQLKEHFSNRRKELNQAHAQYNADLNATLGSLREAQHMKVAINAPQTDDEEPEIAKLPQLRG